MQLPRYNFGDMDHALEVFLGRFYSCGFSYLQAAVVASEIQTSR
jgi:hypothetical protein